MRGGFGITTPDMLQHRSKDDEVSNIFRLIDWKWLAGIVLALCVWGINQWVQYNALLKAFTDLAAQVTKLSDKVDQFNAKTDLLRDKNLEQDFALTRLKERLDSLESWRNAVPVPAARK